MCSPGPLSRRDEAFLHFEAALFNTRSSLQEQAASALRAVAETEFLNQRDASMVAAKSRALERIEALRSELLSAQEDRTNKAESESLAAAISLLPTRQELTSRAEATRAAIADLEAMISRADEHINARRTQFSALLACLHDLTDILERETAMQVAAMGGGIATVQGEDDADDPKASPTATTGADTAPDGDRDAETEEGEV
jgi:hypothetical protein